MIKHFIYVGFLCLPLIAMSQESAFNVDPVGKLPTHVAPHSTINVKYKITNASKTTLENIGLHSQPNGHTPVGVTQISSVPNCTDPFTLKPGESCTLLLKITADDLINEEAVGGPEVCTPSPLRCSIPNPEDELNIKVGSPVSQIDESGQES